MYGLSFLLFRIYPVMIKAHCQVGTLLNLFFLQVIVGQVKGDNPQALPIIFLIEYDRLAPPCHAPSKDGWMVFRSLRTFVHTNTAKNGQCRVTWHGILRSTSVAARSTTTINHNRSHYGRFRRSLPLLVCQVWGCQALNTAEEVPTAQIGGCSAGTGGLHTACTLHGAADLSLPFLPLRHVSTQNRQLPLLDVRYSACSVRVRILATS